MDKITITIDQIKQNPNLDLSERVNIYLENGNSSFDDAEELALATIKQDYEYLVNNRTNFSERTDELLQSVLNGHVLNKIEEFEMFCKDKEKIELYSRCENLKNEIQNNNGITLEDFTELCSIIGLDNQVSAIMKQEFENRGLIIDDYI